MKPLPQMWTRRQRSAVLVIVIVMLICCAVDLLRRPVSISDPPADGSRAAELADRLDPNTADAAALACIPNLGEKRAADIVDYRHTFAFRYPGQTCFTQPDDLMRVKGIGLAMVENMKPFLTFPDANKKP